MDYKVAIGLCLAAVTMGAAPLPTTKPIDIPALITQLQSNDYQQREDASQALVTAYPQHAAEIEAASKRADLDLQAAIELRQIVETQKPRLAAREHHQRLVADSDRIGLAAAVDSYSKVGRHSPAWDAIAGEFLQVYYSPQNDEQQTDDRLIRLDGLIDKLNDAHCEDPMIVYYMARAHQQNPTADQRQCVREIKIASDGLESSDYPVHYKCFAHARYIQGVVQQELWSSMKDWRHELGAELDTAIAEWPAVIQEPSITDYFATDLAENLLNDWLQVKGNPKINSYGDRAKLCDKIFPAWQQAHPKEPGPYVFKGSLYSDYAWEARGNGTSNTVTPDGWKKFAERLPIARQALEQAYQLDPTDSRAPTQMLAIVRDQQLGHEQMELWWQRAMDADPDNYAACTTKLNYLEPKWYGSPAAMIAFGRSCLSAANWEGRIPFILVDAHWTLSQYESDPDSYFTRPEVWTDLHAVYEPYLARYPDSVHDRSYYAFYATRCRQWTEAHRQFDLLGNNPDLTPFNGSRPAYDYLRRKSQLLAAAQ